MRPTRLRAIPLLIAGTLALFTACSAAADSPNDAPRRSPEVVIEGLVFDPDPVTVKAGDTVTWINKDEVDHTVTSGKPGDQGVPGVDEATKPELDGNFDEPLERVGSTFSFTFEERGTYTYFCRVHAAMKAVVVVE